MVAYIYITMMGDPNHLTQTQIGIVRKSLQKTNFDPLVHKAQANCWICLSDFKADDKVSPLECHERHIFHNDCIEEWVKASHNSCPVCRTEIKNLDVF